MKKHDYCKVGLKDEIFAANNCEIYINGMFLK
jgi:hypothetical protein